MHYAFQRKVPLWLGVHNVVFLLPDLIVLGLGKFKVFCSVFQLLSKDLPTWLAHFQVLLCEVFAFFLTLVLVYPVRLLDFSLLGLQQVLYFDKV